MQIGAFCVARSESWETSKRMVFFGSGLQITTRITDRMPRRPQRSPETKWGLIKHDVSSFCGVYSQVLRLNKSGTSAADTLATPANCTARNRRRSRNSPSSIAGFCSKTTPSGRMGGSSPKASSSMRSGAASSSSPAEAADVGEAELNLMATGAL